MLVLSPIFCEWARGYSRRIFFESGEKTRGTFQDASQRILESPLSTIIKIRLVMIRRNKRGAKSIVTSLRRVVLIKLVGWLSNLRHLHASNGEKLHI